MSGPTLAQRLALRNRPEQQRPVMYQSWRDLLFLHWTFDPEVIQQTLPPGLRVDTFDGRAYVGIVPFFMCDVRPVGLPTVPGISNFLETNLRTYVYDNQGTAGVWFYSLDASQWLAVQLARHFFKLPYFYAAMSAPVNGVKRSAGQITYYQTWRRRSGRKLASRFVYQRQGSERRATPGTLEFFLVERYVLFAKGGEDRLATGRVYHQPYPIFDGQLFRWDDHLLTLAGLPLPERPPDHVHMSPGVTVDVYPLRQS